MTPALPYARRRILLGLILAAATGFAAPAAGDSFADGFAAHEARNLQKARRQYARAVQEEGATGEVWYHLGLVEAGLDNPPAAVRAYERALATSPDSPFAYRFRTNLGWAAIQMGEVDRGVAELIAVAEARPEEFDALANVAHALFANAQQYNRAEVWYERLAAAFPTQRGERPLVDMWLREAKQRATITKIGTGFTVYRGDIVGGEYEGRTYGPSPSNNVIVFRTENGTDEIIRKSAIRNVSTEPRYKGMGRAVRLPDDRRAPHIYGRISVEDNMQQGRALLKARHPEAAAEQFRVALRKRPGANDARFASAQALYALERYAEAAPLFEASAAVPDTAARAHYFLVSAYANHLGNLPAALKHALAYIELRDAPQAAAIESAAVNITRQLIARHPDRPEVEWAAAAGLQLDSSVHRRVLGQAFLDEGQPGPALRHLGAAAELGAGVNQTRALAALQTCLGQLDDQERMIPSVAYYRGYVEFSQGRLEQAARTLATANDDMRTTTLLALVRVHQQQVDEARRLLGMVRRSDLPASTGELYNIAKAILDAGQWDARRRSARGQDAFAHARVGAVNGLGVYEDSGEGDLMPIIVACKKNGRGQLEVNGNPLFDLFSVISFKEAFDWVENEVDASFPRQWDTTVTFGGLSLYLAKGGDSAGCAIALALCSAVTGQPVLQDVAVTGAMRMDGRIEPVGRMPAKVLAAVSQDIRTVIVPMANLKDLGTPAPALCSRVKFITASSIAIARYHAFGPNSPATAAAYRESESRFRTASRYYQLGAYALARPALKAVLESTPENYSAQRLLDAIGETTVGSVAPNTFGG